MRGADSGLMNGAAHASASLGRASLTLSLFLFTACASPRSGGPGALGPDAPNHVMHAVRSLQAPSAIGPYSQGIVSGDYLFVSGQIALDPATGALVAGDVAAQTQRTLENLRAVLAAGGCGPADVVKTTVFLLDMNDFAVMNEIYGAFFDPHKPARSTVQVVRLPKDAKVEIECIARIPR